MNVITDQRYVDFRIEQQKWRQLQLFNIEEKYHVW